MSPTHMYSLSVAHLNLTAGEASFYDHILEKVRAEGILYLKRKENLKRTSPIKQIEV